jgi:DNA-binding IclR family transcriptional regulator
MMSDASPTSTKAPAIARAAAILRLLGRSEVPLGVNAIARELDLVPSTCLYVLRALAEEELVMFDLATKRYSLDAGVLTLARGWLRRDRFSDLAQPALERLARDHGVTMLGVQIAGLEHIVVTAAAQGGVAVQLAAHVGSRFPALLSATGRCIAAFGQYPAAQLEAKFRTLRWENPPSYEEWQAQVEATRVQGYGVDEGNYIAGITLVAAPVWKAPGRPSHALVGIGLGGALNGEAIASLGTALVAFGRTISEQMGGI